MGKGKWQLLCQEKPNFSRPTTTQARTQQPRVLSCSDVYLSLRIWFGKALQQRNWVRTIMKSLGLAKGRIPDVIWTLQKAIHEVHRRSKLSINSWSVLMRFAFKIYGLGSSHHDMVWKPIEWDLKNMFVGSRELWNIQMFLMFLTFCAFRSCYLPEIIRWDLDKCLWSSAALRMSCDLGSNPAVSVLL